MRPTRVRDSEGGVERRSTPPVDRPRGPTLELEPGRDPTRPSVRRRGVVDDDHAEAFETEPAAQGDRLVVASFLELGIADEAEHSGTCDRRPADDEPVGEADRDRQSVAEGAAGDLDPG